MEGIRCLEPRRCDRETPKPTDEKHVLDDDTSTDALQVACPLTGLELKADAPFLWPLASRTCDAGADALMSSKARRGVGLHGFDPCRVDLVHPWVARLHTRGQRDLTLCNSADFFR